MFLVGSAFWNKILPSGIDFNDFTKIYNEAMSQINLNEKLNENLNEKLDNIPNLLSEKLDAIPATVSEKLDSLRAELDARFNDFKQQLNLMRTGSVEDNQDYTSYHLNI